MKKQSILKPCIAMGVIACLGICGCKQPTDLKPEHTNVPTAPSVESLTNLPSLAPTESPTEDPMAQYLADIEVITEYDAMTQRVFVTVINHSPYTFSGEIDIYFDNKVDYHDSEIVPMEITDLAAGNRTQGTIDFELTEDYKIRTEIDSYSFIEEIRDEGEEDSAFAEEVKAHMHDHFGLTTWESKLMEYHAFKLSDGSRRIEVTIGDINSGTYQAIAVNILHYDDSIVEVILLDASGNIVFDKSK